MQNFFKVDIIMIEYNKLNRWTFGVNSNKLVKLVLKGKKAATTSLYKIDCLPNKDKYLVCIIAKKRPN